MIIIGSGGHARAVIAAYLSNREHNIKIKGIIDIDYQEKIEQEIILGQTVLGGLSYLYANFEPNKTQFFPAIGNNKCRKDISETLLSKGYSTRSIIHSLSSVDPSAVIYDGSFIGPYAHIGPNATIGFGCIINTMANIEHETCLGPYVFTGPSAVVCGRCSIEELSFLGACSCVIENLTIANNVTIGAGAVVARSIIGSHSKYCGVPARKT